VNIKRSPLHSIVAREPLCPYGEEIEWIINHIHPKNCVINDDKDRCMGAFLPPEVDRYYKFPSMDVILNNAFVTSFYNQKDLGEIFPNW
jgi:hypothetical protein